MSLYSLKRLLNRLTYFQAASEAEREENKLEQRRQSTRHLKYGQIIQVSSAINPAWANSAVTSIASSQLEFAQKQKKKTTFSVGDAHLFGADLRIHTGCKRVVTLGVLAHKNVWSWVSWFCCSCGTSSLANSSKCARLVRAVGTRTTCGFANIAFLYIPAWHLIRYVDKFFCLFRCWHLLQKFPDAPDPPEWETGAVPRAPQIQGEVRRRHGTGRGPNCSGKRQDPRSISAHKFALQIRQFGPQRASFPFHF